MEGKFKHQESRGLPGGPNEVFEYITGVFSTDGYKRDSPDVNNPFNIINSGNITMKGVDFPVMGMDNLGNQQAMIPGNDYQFPGDQVFEMPMAQTGGGKIGKRGFLYTNNDIISGGGTLNFPTGTRINASAVVPKGFNPTFKGSGSFGINQQLGNFNIGNRLDVPVRNDGETGERLPYTLKNTLSAEWKKALGNFNLKAGIVAPLIKNSAGSLELNPEVKTSVVYNIPPNKDKFKGKKLLGDGGALDRFITKAQGGTSVGNEFPEYPLISGTNPNSGVDKRFIEKFKTRVIEPGVGQTRHIQYTGPSNEGKVLQTGDSDEFFIKPGTISDVDLNNATSVKFKGNIEGREKMLKKLNRQNFLGARGFRGSGWKTGLNDAEIQEFKDDNPFFKKGRVKEIDYDLTKADPTKNIYYNDPGSYKFQTGGEPIVVEVGRGPAGLLDKPYWDPENVNLTYDDDEFYESIFDPRIAEKNKANQLAEDNYKKALDERQKAILEIEKAKKLYREVWQEDFKDSTATTSLQARNWAQSQPKWKIASGILDKYDLPSTKLKSTESRSGFTYEAKYDVNADLSDMYPEMPVLNKPFPNIKYNLSDLPEGIDETDFRKWINYYYPDYATNNEIDSATPSRAGNDIIKSAWYELGDQYSPMSKLKTRGLEQPVIENELAPVIPREVESKSRGTLVSTEASDGRTTVQDTKTGGVFGQYDTPEQARIAMIEASTEGYTLNNSSITDISGDDLQKLYDVAESQAPYRPNARQQSNYQALQKLKGYAEGGPIKVSDADAIAYKAYFNEEDKSKKAKKIYDKLNRVYYKKAKAENMSSPNYILTYIITP